MARCRLRHLPATLIALAAASTSTMAGTTVLIGNSGKPYPTVAHGCALNPATGMTQPFVNLFDNGSFLLNVSVNGIPLTQLSALRPHVTVFLVADRNRITAANGSLT